LALGPAGPNNADYTRSLSLCYSNLLLNNDGYQGFTFDKSTVTSPGCIWFEGTASMALAYYFAGQSQNAQYYFTQVSNSMRPNGGLAYTTRGDRTGDVQTNNAMATACWYVLFNQSPKVNPFQLYGTTLPDAGGLPSTYGRLPVIDDFEDGLLIKNNLGLANGHSDNVTNELVTNSPACGKKALKIKYDTTAAWAAWWTTISRDISAYKELSFAVRGERSGNQFTVTFNDEKGSVKELPLSEFLPYGVSDTWQTVSLPLRKFIDFRKLDFRHITTLAFTFTGKDILYLDEIRLVPYESVMDKSFGEGEVFSRILMDRNSFSPNNDGLNETVCFTLEMRSSGSMTLELFDMKGNLVRKFSQTGLTAEFCWDGKDKDNRLLNNGLYVYRITGKDASGKEQKIRKLVLMEK
ncbi:MAG: gliding motility-associated C-terminal domain-containing protein, partial [bacterium]|nr:gliding motility-associated C-terminal domain-containing protein [bacterium]